MLESEPNDELKTLFFLVKALCLIGSPCCPLLLIVFLVARKFEPN